MSEQHTKGLYKKRLNRKEGRWEISTLEATGKDSWHGLAWVWCAGSDPEDDEGKANSDLFVAAPELLEACIAIMDMYRQQVRESHQNSFIVTLTEAAIAKARPDES